MDLLSRSLAKKRAYLCCAISWQLKEKNLNGEVHDADISIHMSRWLLHHRVEASFRRCHHPELDVCIAASLARGDESRRQEAQMVVSSAV